MKELDGELSDTPQWMKVGWGSAALKNHLEQELHRHCCAGGVESEE